MEKDDKQERLELLIEQVDQLRKQRSDLLRRLNQAQDQSRQNSNDQFPLAE